MDRSVELDVELEEALHAALRPPEIVDEPAELGELLLGNVLSGELDCAGLEDAADTEQLAHDFAVEVDDQGERLDDPGWVEVAYEGPCALARLEDPHRSQGGNALAQRRSGDAQPFHQLTFRWQLLSGLENARGDQADDVLARVGRDRVPHERCPSRCHGRCHGQESTKPLLNVPQLVRWLDISRPGPYHAGLVRRLICCARAAYRSKDGGWRRELDAGTCEAVSPPWGALAAPLRDSLALWRSS